LRRIALDLTPLRSSRSFRLLVSGQIVSNLGTQAALVALPYQIFVVSHSPALVGLLGAFELGPLLAVALLGGALADRFDRRVVLLIAQVGVIAVAALLATVTLIGGPPTIALLVLGGALAGAGMLDNVTRAAIIPNVVEREQLRGALAFNFGLYQVAGIVGPALGGIAIAALGVGATYLIDAGSCLAMVGAALAIGPQPPHRTEAHPPILRSIAEGLRFVRSSSALLGSFAIDLVAMTFGMPRALFAVLSLTVYHAGATGTGLLYAAISAGATLAVLTTGWLPHARRLGRIVIGAVLVWGAAIASAGIVSSIGPAIALLAIAGFADSVSAVCRTTINQSVTPDALRGRMSAVYLLVVQSGPRLGDVEGGAVASLTTARVSVLSGGLATIIGVGAILLAFPALAAYDGDEQSLGV
jgi:MFS family permease